MGFWDDKPNSAIEESQISSFDSAKVVAKARQNDEKIREAYLALGKAVYEAEKENVDSKYFREIREIIKYQDTEALWDLYKLSLEGKTKCDSCSAIITSDSAFCNKCGAKVPERDFSALDIEGQFSSDDSGDKKVCPNCGKPLPEGAVFCEKCGTRIAATESGSSDSSNKMVDKSVCPKCGAPLVAEAAFCEKCGEKI